MILQRVSIRWGLAHGLRFEIAVSAVLNERAVETNVCHRKKNLAQVLKPLGLARVEREKALHLLSDSRLRWDFSP